MLCFINKGASTTTSWFLRSPGFQLLRHAHQRPFIVYAPQAAHVRLDVRFVFRHRRFQDCKRNERQKKKINKKVSSIIFRIITTVGSPHAARPSHLNVGPDSISASSWSAPTCASFQSSPDRPRVSCYRREWTSCLEKR